MTPSRLTRAVRPSELRRELVRPELYHEPFRCPCWNDLELSLRGLYCPRCDAEMAGDPPHSAAGGSFRA